MKSKAMKLLTVCGLCLFAGAAQAEKVSLSSFLEPNHTITLSLHHAWADDLRKASNGELDFEVFVGGTLMPPLSHMKGVGDGLAQAGIHGAPYTPAELPIANTLGDMGFRMADEYVLAFAYTDFMMHEAMADEEWKRNNVVFGAGFANPNYYFLCRQDLATLEDMKGKRVRTSGGGWARLAESLGMVPVNIASSEIYTGMERGALDCANADITHLTSGATVLDLTESVVMLPTQPAYISPGIIFNRDWWKSLTPDQRRLIFDTTAQAMARTQTHYTAEVAKAIQAGKEAGVKFNEPDSALVEARDKWVADGVGDMAGVARAKYGIADPEPLYAVFQTYMDKWSGLLKTIDRTKEDQVAALLKANLFDTLDAETYGVN